ncbi:GAF domain-containing protein [Bacillus infantis]|nr:GAF domain-containing protein [Bacillus infantis]
MKTEIEEVQAEIREKGLSAPVKIACYLVAAFLTTLMLYIFSDFIGKMVTLLINSLFGTNRTIGFITVVSSIGVIYMLISLSIKLGNYWRSSGTEIGTSVTNLPNPFRDPTFKKGPLKLRAEYSRLYTRYMVNIKLTEQLEEKHSKVIEQLNKILLRLNVLLRHHENTSRLVESLTYSIKTKEYELENVLSDTLSECITVLEKDQSDKSISLFEVNSDVLKIRDGVRINAESVIKRNFKIGEGFAGSVWETGEAEYINDIDYENDSRFNMFIQRLRPRFRSIMGIPLKVDEKIIGVLCIQSEDTNGFCEDDLRALEFYAHLCTFIITYDKIVSVKGEGSEENGS